VVPMMQHYFGGQFPLRSEKAQGLTGLMNTTCGYKHRFNHCIAPS
jgi:hypothetical protein